MDAKSQEKVAGHGLIIIRPDYKDQDNLRIVYKSVKNRTVWNTYESGFETKKDVEARIKHLLKQHKNYVLD